MHRRDLLKAASIGFATLITGCRGKQHAHLIDPEDDDMVGSHEAGAATWKPLVCESVSKLLGRHGSEIIPVGASRHGTLGVPGLKRRICFVGVENASAEEIGDFKEQIYEQIDGTISRSQVYCPVSRRFVEVALRQTRLRPDELLLKRNRDLFAATIEELDAPFDYLLFAKVTSGTTRHNDTDYQRDYMLTLEMVDVRTGQYEKESAELRKGYHKSLLGKIRHY